MMVHCRVFKIKYLGPTNTKGARVSIYDTRHDKRVIRNMLLGHTSALDCAADYLQVRKSISLLGYSEDAMILYTNDFKNQIK